MNTGRKWRSLKSKRLLALIVVGLIAFALVCSDMANIFTPSLAATNEKTDNMVAGAPNARAQSSEIQNHLEVAKSKDRYVYIAGDCSNLPCVPWTNAHAKPDLKSKVTYTHLQAGSKHKIIGEEKDANGNVWYKLDQDKGIKRPNRIKGSWYVLASETKPGKELLETPFDAQKKIVISIKEQKIRAYEGEKLVHEAKTATGLYKYPTPIGTFKILRKVQTRYMQNGFGSDYFDLPGIAGTMYFTGSGHAIHGAYWHNAFGTRRSHGCVNVPNEDAEWLYEWAAIGTTVVINK